jgi:hypothetical protein
MPVRPVVPADAVQMIAPNFGLQAKIGGPAAKILTPAVYQRAQKSLDAALPRLNEEVDRLLTDLEHVIRQREDNARDVTWGIAHELRGIAGTAGKMSLGVAADHICRYLNGTNTAFKPDASVLTTIATVAMYAVKDGADTDPMIKMLLTDCAQAVDIQRRREGRDRFE